MLAPTPTILKAGIRSTRSRDLETSKLKNLDSEKHRKNEGLGNGVRNIRSGRAVALMAPQLISGRSLKELPAGVKLEECMPWLSRWALTAPKWFESTPYFGHSAGTTCTSAGQQSGRWRKLAARHAAPFLGQHESAESIARRFCPSQRVHQAFFKAL